jgi:hypothetical protein
LIKGYSENERIVICDRTYPATMIPFPVAECSDYADRRLPKIEYLEKMALLIEARGAGAGFVPSERPDSQERDDD